MHIICFCGNKLNYYELKSGGFIKLNDLWLTGSSDCPMRGDVAAESVRQVMPYLNNGPKAIFSHPEYPVAFSQTVRSAGTATIW